MIKQLVLCTLIAIDTDKDGTVSEREIHDYMKAHRPKK